MKTYDFEIIKYFKCFPECLGGGLISDQRSTAEIVASNNSPVSKSKDDQKNSHNSSSEDAKNNIKKYKKIVK